jgi:predicted RND superfamily exporter protein
VNGRRIAALLIAVLALVAAGCGGSSSDEASSDTETTVATETTATDDTTAMEDTTATTDDSETSTDIDLGNLSGECAQFAGISSKLAQSLSGQDANIEDAAKAFDEIADQVPDEIKDDYQVIAENFSKIAEALKGVDLTSGQTPSPEALAKLQELSKSMDSAEVQQASQHIEAWVQEHC